MHYGVGDVLRPRRYTDRAHSEGEQLSPGDVVYFP